MAVIVFEASRAPRSRGWIDSRLIFVLEEQTVIVATLSRSVQIVYAAAPVDTARDKDVINGDLFSFFFLLLQIKFSKYANYQTFLLEYLISISSICFFFFYNRCLNWLSVRISGALNLSSQNCRCVVNHFTVHCSISSFFNIV